MKWSETWTAGYGLNADIVFQDDFLPTLNANGTTVPLVWNHHHESPSNVLGHAKVENRDDGVRAYCFFNDFEFYKKNALQKEFQGSYKVKKVIFNNPATIVLWKDGTKTVVKCSENDIYDPEKGLAMAIVKKIYGNKGSYYNLFKQWLPIKVLITKK